MTHVFGRAFVCALLFWPTSSFAQMGAFSTFNSIHADSIESNAKTGDFTIPSRFSAVRQNMEISGDRASGNASVQTAVVDGNVVVHMTHSVSLLGEAGGSSKGPSTLTCDHLDINAGEHIYHAVGNVRYIQGVHTISADHADFDEASNQLRLVGSVAVEGGSQSGAVGGFDVLKAATILSSSSTGNFTIPTRFIAMRQGMEIHGDQAHGNSRKKQVMITGNVVVKVAKRSGNLTCERLEIDELHHLYHAIGAVQYIEPSRTFSSDTADIDEKNHLLHMKGHVHLVDTSKQTKKTST
jgi:lipopolysaccharide assembly outer membrane protein LptD (OstA)